MANNTSMVEERSDNPIFQIIIVSILIGNFVLNGWIIENYPAVFWADPIIRLLHHDQIFLGRWLPGLQTLIYFVFAAGGNILYVRYAMAAISGFSVFGVYKFSNHFFGHPTGTIAALFMISNPMFLALSTVPYQEVLFIGLIFFGLYFLDANETKKGILPIICFNLACTTRYEAWFLIALLAAEKIIKGITVKDIYGGFRNAIKTMMRLGFSIPLLVLFGNPEIYVEQTAVFAESGYSFVWYLLNEQRELLLWQIRPPLVFLVIVSWIWILRTRDNLRNNGRIVAYLIVNFSVIIVINPFSEGYLRQTFLTLFLLILSTSDPRIRRAPPRFD